MKDFKFRFQGENLFLHPFKSLYWERPEILLIADLHLGKAAHFRKSGIPIPESIHDPDLQRIDYLIEQYRPKRILILGDLFHSAINNSWKYFREFCRDRVPVRPELVLGNHDILDTKNYDFLDLYQDTLTVDPFVFSHKPLENSTSQDGYNICGHIHPAVRLSGIAKQSVRVECFYFGSNHGILPAFGNFTGNAKIAKRHQEDRVFAVTNQKIIPLF